MRASLEPTQPTVREHSRHTVPSPIRRADRSASYQAPRCVGRGDPAVTRGSSRGCDGERGAGSGERGAHVVRRSGGRGRRDLRRDLAGRRAHEQVELRRHKHEREDLDRARVDDRADPCVATLPTRPRREHAAASDEPVGAGELLARWVQEGTLWATDAPERRRSRRWSDGRQTPSAIEPERTWSAQAAELGLVRYDEALAMRTV